MALDRRKITKAIQKRRKELGYTIDTLLYIISPEFISRSTLLRIEAGDPRVSVSKIRLVMEALQMNPADYMDRNTLFCSSLTSKALQKRLDSYRIFFPAESLRLDYPIRCLGDFLNYFHLFDFDVLADTIECIAGCVVGFEEYDLGKVMNLYAKIPESPGKKFADSLQKQNYARYFNSIYSTRAKVHGHKSPKELFSKEKQKKIDEHFAAVRSCAYMLRRAMLYTQDRGDRKIYLGAMNDVAVGAVRFSSADTEPVWYNIRVPLWQYLTPGCKVVVKTENGNVPGKLVRFMVGDSFSDIEKTLGFLPDQDIISVYTEYPMEKIYIPPALADVPPAEEKIRHQRHEWLEDGRFKTKVEIQSDGVLLDGYSAYLAALRLKLPALYCSVVPGKKEDYEAAESEKTGIQNPLSCTTEK